ncbi:MAG TPA: diacylglycerol kinase family protein [Candidatus Saccharimonadia bacterium]|jgi:diacylglycerol kinase
MKQVETVANSHADDHTERVHPYAQSGLLKGMMHAWHGVMHVFRHEHNARLHLMFALLALLIGLWLGVSDAELAAVFFAVILVFLAEIFNTAIERTLDLIDPNENAQVKMIKDMSAGGVLMAAVAAVIIGVAIFGPLLVEKLWAR